MICRVARALNKHAAHVRILANTGEGVMAT